MKRLYASGNFSGRDIQSANVGGRVLICVIYFKRFERPEINGAGLRLSIIASHLLRPAVGMRLFQFSYVSNARSSKRLMFLPFLAEIV